MRKYVLLCAVIATMTCCITKKPFKTGREGKTLPDINIVLDDGTKYFNTSNFTPGSPFVFFYYNPQCPFCKAQIKEITENITKIKKIPFFIITSFSIAEMNGFSNRYTLNKYENVLSGVDSAQSFANYYQVPGVPFIAIFGKDKKLKKAYVGKVSVRQIIESCIDN